MRAILIPLGILLIALGGLILSGRVTRTTTQPIVDIGVFKADAQVREPFPQWTGFLSLALGVGALLGARRRP